MDLQTVQPSEHWTGERVIRAGARAIAHTVRRFGGAEGGARAEEGERDDGTARGAKIATEARTLRGKAEASNPRVCMQSRTAPQRRDDSSNATQTSDFNGTRRKLIVKTANDCSGVR